MSVRQPATDNGNSPAGGGGIPGWALAAAQAAAPSARASLDEVLAVLDMLQVDAPTRAAAVAHMLDCWPAALAAQPHAERLREGLAEADRIWRLHADRPATGNAEGL